MPDDRFPEVLHPGGRKILVTSYLAMPWLKNRGVDTRAFFHPMNLQPCLEKTPGFRSRPCPVAEMIGASGLYLPSGPTLEDAQIEQVCDRLKEASDL